jgi:hypothetical protein
MLNIYAISDLTNNLEIEFNEKEKIFPYCLPDLSPESLLRIYLTNKPILEKLTSHFNLINKYDFRFDWSFYKINQIFFNCSTRILKAMWTNSYYYLYKMDIENAVLEFLNIFNFLKPLKDLAFFSDYMCTGSFIGLVLGALQKYRNNLEPNLQIKIIEKFTKCLNSQISDTLIVKRTLKYDLLFKSKIIEDQNFDELLDTDNKETNDPNEISQYYTMCRTLESRTQDKNKAKKMDSSLKTLKAEILLNIIDLSLKRHRNLLGQYPKSLEEICDCSTVKKIRDPFSRDSFIYKKVDDQSYLIHSSSLIGLREFEASGYHPLFIAVKSDAIVYPIF